MQSAALLLFLSMVGLAQAAVPVAPASPEVNSQARKALLKAFATPEALRHATLSATGLSIGPRLWAASAAARKQFKTETKDTYGITSPQVIAKWRLTPLDLATVPDSVRPVLAEAAEDGTPVLSGAIMSRSDVVLSSIVLSQVKENAFPFSVRRPTDAELEYYYALIPYELTEPILVVESGTQAFLCPFKNDGRLFYFEML